MGSAISCLACGALCTTLSICCSCAGCGFKSCCGGKTAETPKDIMVGKLRSMALMLLSIFFGIFTQYYNWGEKLGYRFSFWRDGCEGEDIDFDTCVGRAVILRVSLVDAVFFALMCLATMISGPLWNNKYWIWKIVLFVGLLFATFFMPNSVFDDVYIWIARIGAFIFSILMQIVLIDAAYTYNDRLVDMADKAGADTEGKKFLLFLLSISLFLLAAALACLLVLFYFFYGCTANDVILSLTLVLCIMAVILQLSGNEGNLLTSSVVVMYAVFMAYSAVSRNPKLSCNPVIGNNNTTSIVTGLLLSLLSIAWLCANASTSITKLMGGDTPPTTIAAEKAENARQNESDDGNGGSDKFLGYPKDCGVDDNVMNTETEEELVDDGGDGWKFNFAMVLISFYVGMQLTNWGVTQDTVTADYNEDIGKEVDPQNGHAAMWLTATSQLICLLLYSWTMIAPRLFPNRDFS